MVYIRFFMICVNFILLSQISNFKVYMMYNVKRHFYRVVKLM